MAGVKVYPLGLSLPGTVKKLEPWTCEGHLFHPTGATKERGRGQQTCDRIAPQCIRTEEEKERHADKKRKDVQKRLHEFLPPHSKTSKEARLMKRRKVEMRTAAASSAGTNAASGTDQSAACIVPLRSYLRPANIIGGGFLRTKTGYAPRVVNAHWERHCSASH